MDTETSELIKACLARVGTGDRAVNQEEIERVSDPQLREVLESIRDAQRWVKLREREQQIQLTAMASRQRNLESLVRATADAIILANGRGVIRVANESACSLFGYPVEAMIGRLIEDLMPERYRLAHRYGMQRFVDYGESTVSRASVKLAALRSDGSEVPIELSLCGSESREGWMFGAIIRDMRPKLGQTPAARRLASVVQHSADAVLGIGIDGKVVHWSEGARQLLGYAPEAMVGQTCMMLASEPHRAAHAKLIKAAFRGESRSVETVCRRQDGREVDVLVTASRVEALDGSPPELAIVLRDISELKEAERQSRAMAQFAELNPGPVLRVNGQGKIMFTNPAARTLLGLPEGGGSIFNLLKDLSPKALHGLVGSGQRRYHECVVGERVFGFDIVPLAGIFHLYGRDVSEQISLARTLAAAQRMDAVGQLAGGVAHDFNNLLVLIGTAASFLLDEVHLDDPRRDDVVAIDDAWKRAANLTRQLLVFSRGEPQELRPICMNALVEGAVPMLERVSGEDILISAELGPDLPPISADTGQVEQILMNLVVNARDAMHSGGRLVIRTRFEALAAAESAAESDLLGHVYLEVEDTGSGIAEAELAKIFDPFFTTKAEGKGTGLGLSTVYGLAKRHGGVVLVESVVGEGSTFRVGFPAQRDIGEVLPEDAAAASMRSMDLPAVLLVEDKRQVRKALSRMIDRLGCFVIEAESGQEALAMIDEGDRVDLLVTDVVMPHMSGPELAKEVAKRIPEIRVMFVSGHDYDKISQAGLDRSRAHLLSKPFTPEDLARKIRAVMSEDLDPPSAS